ISLPVYRPLPGSGRAGEHTEHLAPLLTELQGIARAHPEATW
ncbi:Phenylacetic acid catabolic protein, partial [Streptomyces anthocyanicus]